MSNSHSVEQGITGNTDIIGKGKLHKGFALRTTKHQDAHHTPQNGMGGLMIGSSTSKNNPSPEKSKFSKMKTILKSSENGLSPQRENRDI